MHVLFLGFNHSVGDPRLCYRQIPVLRESAPDVEVTFLASTYKADLGVDAAAYADDVGVDVQRPPKADAGMWDGLEQMGRIRRALRYRWRRVWRPIRQWAWKYRALFRTRPDVVQASDARELPFAVLTAWVLGHRLIYDSHEDYFNQVYEYRGKTWTALRKAVWLSLKEIALARFADHVFVTSLSHRGKYEHWSFGIGDVDVLPNFAPTWLELPETDYEPTSTLRLVYVGSVNAYRGVTEMAEFSARYTERHPDRTVKVHFIGGSTSLTDTLAERGLLIDEGPLPYPEMMRRLCAFDVGVCLLHDIQKFHTSVPVKNFDYMAAGLPVLTSDFGEMKRYVDASDAGICIAPTSYDAFETALDRLFDPDERRRLGENGRAYAREEGSFENAAEPYVRHVLSTSPSPAHVNAYS